MFGFSTAKLIGFGIGLIGVLVFIAMALSWRSERNQLREWQSTVVTATREASDNPKLNKRDVPQQIRALGQAIFDLKAGILRQNTAVNQLAAESGRQKAAAAQASQKAQERAQDAQATSARLTASSRSSDAPGSPCAPSKALTEAWQ